MSSYFFTHFALHTIGTLGGGISNFPWLSVSILFPIGCAFLIPFFPDKGEGKEVRWFALSVALITFLVTVGSYINGFDINNEDVQLKESINWLPNLGLTWSVGADGMSMPLILLTSFITALAVLAAWPVKFKPKLFFFLILIMDGGQIAVFAVQDMLLFFLSWELELLPVYLLLAIWGGKNRQYAATKFIIYTAGSSIFILLAALAMGFYGTEVPNFEFSHLANQDFGQNFQILCYIGLLIAFGVKLPIVPLHTWLPDAHGEATAPVHMLLAGILLKMGGYALLRFNAQLLPIAHAQFAPLLIVLGVVNIIYAALTSFAQRNLKRKIAYSSISHMGYALAGLATVSNQGIQSSITYISIYLVMNLAFFSCLFMLKRDDKYYENIEDLSGLSKKHPILSFSLLIVLFSLAEIPPLAGFFAKFYVFLAVIEQSMYFLAIVGLLATVVAAFYYLRIIKIIYFDPEKEEYETSHNLGLKITLAISTIFILAYFLYPSGITEIVSKITMI